MVQNQGFIDSLLQGYQIPLFYVHLDRKTNTFTGSVETTAWLVDGQQRLHAIAAYRQNEFSLADPQRAAQGTVLPVHAPELPAWTGKKFEDLAPEDRDRLLGRELLVVEMSEEKPNEVRDLFIRLQAGTPLTAQEKRDAWPGDFTLFVIRHAGKSGHSQSNPKPFFKAVPRQKGLSVDDGDHYVDGLAETRKFFAGLAMTIMVRERSGEDFVDLKGKTINDFYKENLDLRDDDPATERVTHTLDRVAQLAGFESLMTRKPMPFSMAFHLALLVDSLNEGNYVPVWRDDVVNAFIGFQEDVAKARLHCKNTKESLPHYARFAVLLGGSGSDTADGIRRRHSFFLSKVYPAIRIKTRDESRCFGALEKEVIWNRDREQCKNPVCHRRVPFREATIHHIVEHTTGGQTTLENGILICPECHADRAEMQRLTAHFQAYIRQVNANTAPVIVGGEVPNVRREESGDPDTEQAPERLKIVIHWRALGVSRDDQTIAEDKASTSIVKLLVALITTFGEPLKQQLTELPVIRYPLSRTPTAVFLTAAGQQLNSVPVPGTDLHFCPHSDNQQKVRQLRKLFSLLALPDGRDFPSASVEVSIDAEPPTPRLL